MWKLWRKTETFNQKIYIEGKFLHLRNVVELCLEFMLCHIPDVIPNFIVNIVDGIHSYPYSSGIWSLKKVESQQH